MKIESKFDIGQKVWSIQNNKIRESLITEINLGGVRSHPNDAHGLCNTEVVYGLDSNVDRYDDYTPRYENVSERDIFKTKQELIDSL